MSIEIDHPQTLLEKVDAAANLVEQMYLAAMIGDKPHLQKTHSQVAKILSDVIDQIGE